MDFATYLMKQSIDPMGFQTKEGQYYAQLNALFSCLGPAAFTGQKRFLLNAFRRKYPCKKPTQQSL